VRAVIYTEAGDSSVLQVVDREVPEPGPGEVRVRIVRSAVNPTDWKSRSTGGRNGPLGPQGQVPHQDGAGVIDSVGPGVDPARTGTRVWIWEGAGSGPQGGTAAQFCVVPADHAVPLPPEASFDLGASLGVPALTAHRCLTINEDGPAQLAPGALAGRTVLVTGGAGAVGHAAIQLARWAGAQVLTTISSDEKARLAQAAGAHHVINYRTQDAAAAVRELVPGGVSTIVEVAASRNADLDVAVIGPHGAVAIYADDGGEPLTIPVRPLMVPNARWQFVLLYTVPEPAKRAAIAAVRDAVAAGALEVGQSTGLPLHHYPLDKTADAQDAVQSGVVGKVLVDVDPHPGPAA
jgi:NADPH:quinone reductase